MWAPVSCLHDLLISYRTTQTSYKYQSPVSCIVQLQPNLMTNVSSNMQLMSKYYNQTDFASRVFVGVQALSIAQQQTKNCLSNVKMLSSVEGRAQTLQVFSVLCRSYSSTTTCLVQTIYSQSSSSHSLKCIPFSSLALGPIQNLKASVNPIEVPQE